MIRRIVLAFAALALLSGCAAGHNAVTLKEYTPTDGNQVTTDVIKVRNLVLVAGENGNADLIATIVNVAPAADSLVSASVNGVPVTLAAESLELATDQPLVFGGESASATGSVALPNVRSGQIVDVELRFANAGLLEATALVREPILEFAPTPAP